MLLAKDRSKLLHAKSAHENERGLLPLASPKWHCKSRRGNPRLLLPSPLARRHAIYAAATEIEVREDSEEAVDEPSFQGVPQIWQRAAEQHGDLLAVMDPHHAPAVKLTFRQLNTLIQQFTAGLAELGLKKGDKTLDRETMALQVALFSENSARWLVADQSIMSLGAADAVRGSTSPAEEMAYIISKSDSCGVVVQDAATLERMLPAITAPPASSDGNRNGASNGTHRGSGASSMIHKQLKFVVVLWGEPSGSVHGLDCPVLSFNDLLAKAGNRSVKPVSIRGNDLATLVFTSGTTGAPKAVELTHANLAYQIRNLSHFLPIRAGNRTLSLLPPWHIYERSSAYYVFSQGSGQVYTTIRKFKDDLTKYPPNYFVCVPLVLDSLHNKVMAQIKRGSAVKKAVANFFLSASTAYVRAKRITDGIALQYAIHPRPLWALVWATLTAALLYPLHRLGQALVYNKIRQAVGIKDIVVSGGGSLATHLDDFFEVLGLQTSPVLACRKGNPAENVRGSVGTAIPETQIKVVDPVSLEEVSDGEKGLMLARGPGVMRGYYNDADATRKAMRAGDGWFDTGDLGWRAPEGVAGSRMAGTIVLTGREKDTIVLSNGENIEPQPIEDACCASNYISQMIVVGNDRRRLGALVAPCLEAFQELEAVKGSMSEQEKRDVIRAEIRNVVSQRPMRENIHEFVILPAGLSPEDGTLTRTMKIRRQVIMEKYEAEVSKLYALLK